jgi:phosphonate dehydrogenase
MKPRVVITQWVHPEVIDLLQEHCEVVPNTTRDPPSASELRRRTQNADAVMVFMPDTVDGPFLDAAPRLKIVAGALKGYDNFDVEACSQRGVWLTIVPDLLTVPTAELTIGLMIGLGRKMAAGDRMVRSDRFPGWRPVLYGTGLAGATAGIIGLGAVGSALARRLAAFDMTVLASDQRHYSRAETDSLGVTVVPFDDLLASSDYVLPMVPLTPVTRHLVNTHTIRRMKRGVLLVNACRGSVVDELAVRDALRSGHLGGYAADVFEFEDWALDDRLRSIPEDLLLDEERTFFSPHIGSAVDTVRRDIAMEAARNIIEAVSGRSPTGAVNSPALASV